jgi:hypothetical protein
MRAIVDVTRPREDMTHLLPRVNGTKRHFAALDYKDVPAFVRELEYPF